MGFEKKKETKTKAEIDAIIDGWLEDRECNFDEETANEYKRPLFFAVKKDRLSYNDSERSFTYMLKSPIKNDKGEDKYSMFKISPSKIGNKTDIEKQKLSIDQTIQTFKAYCTDTNGEEIPIGFLMKIDDDDQDVLLAIILGFFVKAVPKHMKSE